MYSFSNKRDRTQLAVGVSKPYTYILGGDYSRLASYKGKAAVEGWGKGGAIQYELSSTVELERLGLLREIN